MRTQYIKVDGVENGIDFDAHYRVSGYQGIAFFLLGWAANQDEDGELEADTDNVIAVMVGDDRRHTVDVSDLEVLPEDKFCRSCGQIGCHCNVYA